MLLIIWYKFFLLDIICNSNTNNTYNYINISKVDISTILSLYICNVYPIITIIYKTRSFQISCEIKKSAYFNAEEIILQIVRLLGL